MTPRLKARRQYRQLKRRIPEGEAISHLNITAMMDMMTILLIFFLKNFSVSVENINFDENLTLPRSTSAALPRQAVQVTVTRNAILVESGTRAEAVAAISDGAVDPAVKPDGPGGFVIEPLLALLQRHTTRLKLLEQRFGESQKFQGEIVIIADQTTPYRLLSEVLYTAGQAEYARYRLMVLQSG